MNSKTGTVPIIHNVFGFDKEHKFVYQAQLIWNVSHCLSRIVSDFHGYCSASYSFAYCKYSLSSLNYLLLLDITLKMQGIFREWDHVELTWTYSVGIYTLCQVSCSHMATVGSTIELLLSAFSNMIRTNLLETEVRRPSGVVNTYVYRSRGSLKLFNAHWIVLLNDFLEKTKLIDDDIS